MDFRSESANRSENASHRKVNFCDAHRTARIAGFGREKQHTHTHTQNFFGPDTRRRNAQGKNPSLGPKKFYARPFSTCNTGRIPSENFSELSHRGLQKHIASQTRIARFGELSTSHCTWIQRALLEKISKSLLNNKPWMMRPLA